MDVKVNIKANTPDNHWLAIQSLMTEGLNEIFKIFGQIFQEKLAMSIWSTLGINF